MSAPFGFILLIFVVAELILSYGFPRALAWLATIPLGTSTLRVPPDGRRALIDLPAGESGYRERRMERLALERLEEREVRAANYVAWIRPARRDIIISLRYRYMKGRGLGLARTRLDARGDVIVATTRQVPLPVALWLLFLSYAVLDQGPSVMVVPLLATVLNLTLSRGALSRARDECLAELENSLHGFGSSDDRKPRTKRRKHGRVREPERSTRRRARG